MACVPSGTELRWLEEEGLGNAPMLADAHGPYDVYENHHWAGEKWEGVHHRRGDLTEGALTSSWCLNWETSVVEKIIFENLRRDVILVTVDEVCW